MPKEFVRPSALRFPQIYATFDDYLIQELPEECFDEALDLLVNETDETLHACRGLADSSEVRDDWRQKLAGKISIACFKSDGSDGLVAVSVLGVVGSHETAEFGGIASALNYIAMQHNVFEEYGVIEYLTVYGLVVSREFRQRGIACEMLKAQVDVTRVLGVSVTSSIFTTFASQRAAERAGYKEVYSISFEELGQAFPAFDFTSASAEYAKILDFQL